jgi:hypothetical protein
VSGSDLIANISSHMFEVLGNRFSPGRAICWVELLGIKRLLPAHACLLHNSSDLA